MAKRDMVLLVVKFLSVFSIVLLIFGIVWLRSSIVNLEYTISKLEKTKTHLMKENKGIVAEKVKLLALERFERADQRGFVFPDRIRVIYVKENKSKEPYRVVHSKRQ